MMNKFTISMFAALLSAGASFADTKLSGSYAPTVQTPVSAPVMQGFSWTGAYAGIGLGYGSMSASGSSSRRGGALGVFGGYRMDMGAGVVGVEAQLAPLTLGTYNLGADRLRWGGALLLSYGMKLGQDERTLASVGVGPAFLNTRNAGSSETSTGIRGQLALDYMLTDTMMLRGSVTHSRINNVGVGNRDTRTTGLEAGMAFKF